MGRFALVVPVDALRNSRWRWDSGPLHSSGRAAHRDIRAPAVDESTQAISSDFSLHLPAGALHFLPAIRDAPRIRVAVFSCRVLLLHGEFLESNEALRGGNPSVSGDLDEHAWSVDHRSRLSGALCRWRRPSAVVHTIETQFFKRAAQRARAEIEVRGAWPVRSRIPGKRKWRRGNPLPVQDFQRVAGRDPKLSESRRAQISVFRQGCIPTRSGCHLQAIRWCFCAFMGWVLAACSLRPCPRLCGLSLSIDAGGAEYVPVRHGRHTDHGLEPERPPRPHLRRREREVRDAENRRSDDCGSDASGRCGYLDDYFQQ